LLASSYFYLGESAEFQQPDYLPLSETYGIFLHN